MPAAPRDVSFHPAARAEFLRAEAWYADRSQSAAEGFVGGIEHALSRIVEAPDRYPETRRGCRRFVLLKFPFDVIYTVRVAGIRIIAVAHHGRRPGYWQSR